MDGEELIICNDFQGRNESWKYVIFFTVVICWFVEIFMYQGCQLWRVADLKKFLLPLSKFFRRFEKLVCIQNSEIFRSWMRYFFVQFKYATYNILSFLMSNFLFFWAKFPKDFCDGKETSPVEMYWLILRSMLFLLENGQFLAKELPKIWVQRLMMKSS